MQFSHDYPLIKRWMLAMAAFMACSILQGCFSFGNVNPQPESLSERQWPLSVRVEVRTFDISSVWKWEKAPFERDVVAYVKKRNAFRDVVSGPADLVLVIDARVTHSRPLLAERLDFVFDGRLVAGEHHQMDVKKLGSYTGTASYTAILGGDGIATIAAKGMSHALGQIFDKIDEDREAVLAKIGKSAPAAAAAPSIPNAAASTIENPAFDAGSRIMGEDDIALVIGIEKYQDLPASDYSTADAKLVKDYFLSLGIKQRNIELLLNERATGTGIRKVVESWLPNRTQKSSRVFVYYSGHGAPDPGNGEAYMVPYDGDPNYLTTTGYPLKNLYDNLGRLPAAEVLVVLDSCFSGAGGRSVLAKGARPLVMMQRSQVPTKNMAVLAATDGSQISTVSPDKRHGLLTYYFLKSIQDGKTHLSEIYKTLKPEVEDEAKLLNVNQTPTLLPESAGSSSGFRLRK